MLLCHHIGRRIFWGRDLHWGNAETEKQKPISWAKRSSFQRTEFCPCLFVNFILSPQKILNEFESVCWLQQKTTLVISLSFSKATFCLRQPHSVALPKLSVAFPVHVISLPSLAKFQRRHFGATFRQMCQCFRYSFRWGNPLSVQWFKFPKITAIFSNSF